MGRDSERNHAPTARISKDELAQLAELSQSTEKSEDLEAFAEWNGAELAGGTPPHASTPSVPRTSTVHDPMTTAMLAQIARGELADEDPAPPSRPTPSPHVKPR